MSYYVGHEATRGINVSPLNGIVHRWLIQTLFLRLLNLLAYTCSLYSYSWMGKGAAGQKHKISRKQARPGLEPRIVRPYWARIGYFRTLLIVMHYPKN